MLAPLLLAAATAAASPAAAQTNAEAVVAAERAFAASAHDHGMAAAFLESMDQERAIRLTPESQSAYAFWSKQKNRTGAPYLTWRPVWAAASSCGADDYGFTTGPYAYGDKAFGYYFTIWGRKASGQPFRWVLDAGVDRASDPHVPADAPVTFAAPAAGKWLAAHHDTYWTEVDLIDRLFDAARAGGVKAAYAARLAPDARAMGLGLEDPAIGKAAVLAAISARGEVAMVHQGAFVSQCGDLGFTYGTADWTSLGKLVNGNYVRVWRHAGPKWMLLFEEVVTPG
jgi:hypothetical protein